MKHGTIYVRGPFGKLVVRKATFEDRQQFQDWRRKIRYKVGKRYVCGMLLIKPIE